MVPQPLATAAQGLTASYTQLVLARVMVGIGEAAGGPVAHSMICDLFPTERRGFALSLWNTAIPMGTLLGLLLVRPHSRALPPPA